MMKDDIRFLLDGLLDKEPAVLSAPTSEDWLRVEAKFNCRFPSDFISFIELMSEYSFPGDILNISDVDTNGNDTIEFTYDYEMKHGMWKKNLIPFYSIGNGDYFCLLADTCPKTGVYYYSHDDNSVVKEADSFEDWLKQLPAFLS